MSKKSLKSILAFLLALLVLSSSLPVVFATTDNTAKGVCIKNAAVGEIITYTCNYDTPNIIEDIQAYVEYDADKLSLLSYNRYNMFPNLSYPIYNSAIEGIVIFLDSNVGNGFDFRNNEVLVTLQFEVIAEGDAVIKTVIEVSTEYYGVHYIDNCEILCDGVSYSDYAYSDGDAEFYPASAHIEGEYVSTATPDCVNEGYDIYICDSCGEDFKTNFVDAVGHINGDYVSTATPDCVSGGFDIYVCDVCGEEFETDYVDALGHSFKDDGFCSLCGEEQVIESQHNYPNYCDETWTIYRENSDRIAITFSEYTYTERNYDFICIYDGDNNLIGEYSGGELSGERIIIHSDTVKIRLTSDYSINYYGFKVDKIETYYGECTHTNTELKYYDEATCENYGYTGDTYCDECGDFLTEGEYIDPTGHDYKYITTVEPSCVEVGYDKYVCENCGDVEKKNLVDDLGGHIFVDGICTVCGSIDKAQGYNRYYFYMPEEWYNEYATTAGVYWWEGTDACSYWPGYVANETNIDGIYYYDVNQDVTTIIWNNAIDGGTDMDADIYSAAYHTKNIGTEYYDPGESPNYPDGTDNFDEMIYVIDLSKTEVNEFSGKSAFVGEWFYYYGNGEYGFTPEKGDTYFNSRSYYGTPEPVEDVVADETDAVEEPTDATEAPTTEAPVVTDPVETTVATEPTEATVSTDSVEPTNPAESAVVTEPAESAVVTEPAESTVVTEPAENTAPTTDATIPTTTAPTTTAPAKIYTDEKTQISVESDNIDKEVELKVEEISDDKQIEDIDFILTNEKVGKIYDITLQKDGVEVQPDGKVKVRIPAENEASKVYRVEKDGTLTDMGAVYEDGYMVFTTEHFSLYVVTVKGETADSTPDESIPDFELGDVNMDGKVNIKDATTIQKYAAKLVEFDDVQMLVADFDNNGKVNVRDATAIQKKLAGLI